MMGNGKFIDNMKRRSPLWSAAFFYCQFITSKPKATAARMYRVQAPWQLTRAYPKRKGSGTLAPLPFKLPRSDLNRGHPD